MIPEGSLVEQDVPSLVRSLYEERWTGLLTVTDAGVGKSITVQDGRMVFASSSSADDRLGELLLVQGVISLRQFLDGSKAIRPDKRLGTVLVEMGALTPKQLVKAVIDQTQAIIYSVFLWTEGHYRLQAGPPSPEAIKLNLSTPDLIMEGIRRIRIWSRVERAVGGADACYRRSPEHGPVLAQVALAPEARAIADGLDGPKSVSEMCAASALPDFEVCQAVWAFRVTGILIPVEAAPRVEEAGGPDDDGLGAILGAAE